jgi:chorismate--pyruvate lyase
MAPHALALVREVELCCGEQPWVFARSLIPLQSLQGAGRRLQFLGDRPLGSLLFSDPKATRGPMEFARLLPGHCLYEKALANRAQRPAQLWGRRTLFFFAGKPLLVNEVFLDGIGIYGD